MQQQQINLRLRMATGATTTDVSRRVSPGNNTVDRLKKNFEPNTSPKVPLNTKSPFQAQKEISKKSSTGRREAPIQNVETKTRKLVPAKSEPNLSSSRSKTAAGSRAGDKTDNVRGHEVKKIINNYERKTTTATNNSGTPVRSPVSGGTRLKNAPSKQELDKQTDEGQGDVKLLNENVKGLVVKVEGLRKEIYDLQTENREFACLQNQVADLKFKNKTIASLESEVSNLKFEKHKFEKKLVGLEMEVANLKTENQLVGFLQSEVSNLKLENQKFAFLRKEVSDLKIRNKTFEFLQKEVSDLRTENQKIALLQIEVSNLKFENENVVKELKTESERLADLEKAVAGLKVTITNSQVINPSSQNASQEENKTPTADKRSLHPTKSKDEKIQRIFPKPEETGFGKGHSSRDTIKASGILEAKSLYHVGCIFGIEGHNNSCYMDSSLNSMFLFTNAFHQVLENKGNLTKPTRKSKDQQNPSNEKLKKHLRDEIAEPLSIAKGLKLNSGIMSRFRKLLGDFNFDYYDGHEMDPEEFISTLFGNILKTPGFYWIDGDSEGSYVFQTYADMTKRTAETDVQSLLEYSFSDSEIFLQSIPSPGFIIKMPVTNGRHMFKTVYPNPIIDLKNIIIKANRRNSSETKMRLSAVICLSGHHFTTFIRETEDRASPWWYLDSFSSSGAVLHKQVDKILANRECSQEWPLSGLMKNCYMCFYLPVSST